MHYILRAAAGLLLLTVIAGLAGCASVPMADSTQDAQAKKFIPPNDMAGVYIYRVGTYAADIVIPVGIDGQFMGRTAVDTYFYWKVSPGRHIIVTGGYKPEQYKMDFEAGKNYFFKQDIRVDTNMGVNTIVYTTYTTLISVSRDQGKKAVLKCGLIASSQPKAVATQQNDEPRLEDLRGLLQPQQR